MNTFTTKFGCLPRHVDVQFSNWSIKPLLNFKQTIKIWESIETDSQWVHPPLRYKSTIQYNSTENKEVFKKIEGSEKESVIWNIPATHELTYTSNRTINNLELKKNLSTFIIYLLGAIFDVELQHDDWFVTGRQKKKSTPFIAFENEELKDILEQSIHWFCKAKKKEKITIISALYIHNHAPSYHWGWENFLWQYSVFDAAWYLAERYKLVPEKNNKGKIPHKGRFHIFSKHLKLKRDSKKFKKWVTNRNNLIHQNIWGNSIPGHATNNIEDEFLYLRGFIFLSILVSIGIKAPLKKINWKLFSLGTVSYSNIYKEHN